MKSPKRIRSDSSAKIARMSSQHDAVESAIVQVQIPRSIQTTRTDSLRSYLENASAQRDLLRKFVGEHMVEGVDYGVIPGTKQRSLLKPGAEKLMDLFECAPSFNLVTQEEDFETGLFNYTFQVKITSRATGSIHAEGFGSANSREGRYRWRAAQRQCPQCGKAAIIKGKAEYGGGWLCFGKKGGCGTKFQDDAPEIISQPEGKIENDDIASMANTILKMAKKRALVDGAIALARCSDLFTQDLEDDPPAVLERQVQPPKAQVVVEDNPFDITKITDDVSVQIATVLNSATSKADLKGRIEKIKSLLEGAPSPVRDWGRQRYSELMKVLP